MKYRGRTRPLHPQKWLVRAREAFLEARGKADSEQRAHEIAALPVVEWRGERLYTIRCCGDYGKGPHDRHVPEALLWSLIDLRVHRCPYHT